MGSQKKLSVAITDSEGIDSRQDVYSWERRGWLYLQPSSPPSSPYLQPHEILPGGRRRRNKPAGSQGNRGDKVRSDPQVHSSRPNLNCVANLNTNLISSDVINIKQWKLERQFNQFSALCLRNQHSIKELVEITRCRLNESDITLRSIDSRSWHLSIGKEGRLHRTTSGEDNSCVLQGGEMEGST